MQTDAARRNGVKGGPRQVRSWPARTVLAVAVCACFLGSTACRRSPEPQKPSLYVVNWRGGTVTSTSLSGSSISAFAIDESTGRLTPVPGSPFRHHEAIPRRLRVSGDGSMVFLDAAAIRRSPHGLLSPLPRARDPFLQSGTDRYRIVGGDPYGRFVFGALTFGSGRAPLLRVFRLDSAAATIEALGGASWETRGEAHDIAVDPLGMFLYVLTTINSEKWVYAYAFDPAKAALTAVPGSPFQVGRQANRLRVHPSVDWLLVAAGEAYNRPDLRIQTFRIDYVSGALQPATGSGQYPGAEITGLAIEPTGRFFYVAEYSNDRLWGFEIDSRGGFAPVPGSPFRTGRAPSDVVVDSSGRFVYVANSNSNNLSAYAIDANSGTLTPVDGSPFATGTEPTVLAVTPRQGSPIKCVELRDPPLPGAGAQPAETSAVNAAGVWPPDGASVADLISRLDNADWRVRDAAAMAIGRRGARASEAIPALIHALDDEKDEIARSSAYALGSMGPAARDAVPRLRTMLASSSPSMREAASRALGEIGTEASAAAPDLIESLKREDFNGGARARTLEALARVGADTATAAPAIVPLLASSDVRVQKEAVKTLQSYGADARAVVPQLIVLLEDPRPYTAAAAADVLGSIGPAAGAAVPALVGLCQSRDSTARDAATKAFYRIRAR